MYARTDQLQGVGQMQQGISTPGDQMLTYDSSMRIAFDHQIFSMQSYGGISRYFARLAEELDATGQTVSVMAQFHRNHHLEEVAGVLVDGRSVTAWPDRLGKLAKKLNNSLTARSVRRWQPDILHETYYQGRVHRALEAPVVVTVYDMIHEIMPEVFRRNDQTSIRKRNAVLRADHVICISENTRQDLLRFIDVNPGKTSVVHLGVDKVSKGRSETHTAQSDKQQTSDKRAIALYVGQRGGYKNFSLLLKAVASSSRLMEHMDIVCFGGGAFSDEENAQATGLGFRPDQISHETGDDTKLARWYQQADVFVHSSRYEGFGLPPLEAMAQGCPVVSSNASCMPEVLGDAAHYFDPASLEDLQQALEAVVGSSEYQQQLAEAGYRHAEALSWNRCAQKTLAVYESMLS